MPGGGSNSSTTVRELAPEQRELLEQVIPVAKDISQNPPDLFPGSSISPFTPLQEQGQAAAVDTAINTLQPLAESTASASQTLQETL